MQLDLNLISLLAFGAVVLLAGWVGFRLLRDRLDQQRYQEELADLEFQEKLLASLGAITGDDDSRFLQSETADVTGTATAFLSAKPLTTTNAPTVSTAPLQPNTPSASPLPADAEAEAVMRQLHASGLVTMIDGYVPLHNNPKGAALLKLRNGKLALLVPHMESETFLRRNARRADIIIMAGADGKAVVVTPLEQFLAETISPS